jgi:phenylpropionate dioxygenase-like ring-hydroxylating dioxygenase large terminal subunit
MSFLKSYLGFGANPAADNEKATIRALPAPWYTSQDMYELERRAIFSRKWLLTTHKSRVPNTGDWVRYEVAGYEFVVVRDNKGVIHAFHNVCRHRGFPIVTKDEGNSYVFSCKYHGWSYGLSGNLAKAPGYQELPGFDKSQNNLFKIHVHIDRNGFIWVNLDASETPEVAWDDDFKGVDEQPRFSSYQFEDYVYDHTWEQSGDYNWKILADNYNECYHCKTTHPDLPAIADLESYYVECKGTHIQHYGNPSSEQIDSGYNVVATYFWPNASMNVTPNFFFIQRFIPQGPVRSNMKYEVYRNKNATDEDFQVIDAMYKRIMSEDKFLCISTQRNLQAGVFVNGQLHPRLEKGPLYFQKTVRDVMTAHFAKEQKEGQEIWPARQRLPKEATVANNDTSFCSAVDCCRNANMPGNPADSALATEIKI